MQMLSQLDVQGEDALEQIESFLAESEADAHTIDYARSIIQTCWEQHGAFDGRIAGQLRHWGLDRLSPVERNVIRVALMELSGGQVPPKVVINEAVEIGREYGGADTPRFVNGILDALWKAENVEVKSEK